MLLQRTAVVKKFTLSIEAVTKILLVWLLPCARRMMRGLHGAATLFRPSLLFASCQLALSMRQMPFAFNPSLQPSLRSISTKSPETSHKAFSFLRVARQASASRPRTMKIFSNAESAANSVTKLPGMLRPELKESLAEFCCHRTTTGRYIRTLHHANLCKG